MSCTILFFSLIAGWLFEGTIQMKDKIDLIVTNGIIYTVDNLNTQAEAMAIHHGKILAVGTKKSISERFQASGVIDLKGKYVYPGFIDAHCHFIGYALGLQYVDLFGCKS